MYGPPPQYGPPQGSPPGYPQGYPPPPPPRSGTSPIVIILVVLAAVFLLGLGTCAGVFFVLRRAPPAPDPVPYVVYPSSAPGGRDGGGNASAGPKATIDRPGYSLDYPTSWTVDTEDKDYDPDAYFAIDQSEGCTIAFFFFDVKGDPERHIQAQVDAQRKRLMPNPTLVPFTTWGRYDGKGMTMTGRMKPLGQGRIRIFSHPGKSTMFDVVEFCFEDDLPDAKPGFEMIESSFKLKKE